MSRTVMTEISPGYLRRTNVSFAERKFGIVKFTS